MLAMTRRSLVIAPLAVALVAGAGYVLASGATWKREAVQIGCILRVERTCGPPPEVDLPETESGKPLVFELPPREYLPIDSLRGLPEPPPSRIKGRLVSDRD